MKTKVSFIIPALNEEKRIAVLIDNIKILGNWCDYEIIVSDGHSTDNTAVIAEIKGARVIKDDTKAPKTIANGRNTGARLATGEIYIFCDADTVIKNPYSFLSDIFKVFYDPEIVG